MLHVVESQASPGRGADQRSYPPNKKIHLVVGVSVSQEHVHHQDVVEVETL